MRTQANTAKLFEDNPTLMRLRELETLEKVADKGRLSVVLGEGGLAGRIGEDAVVALPRARRAPGEFAEGGGGAGGPPGDSSRRARSVATRRATRDTGHADRREGTPHVGPGDRGEPVEAGDREPLAELEDAKGYQADEQQGSELA